MTFSDFCLFLLVLIGGLFRLIRAYSGLIRALFGLTRDLFGTYSGLFGLIRLIRLIYLRKKVPMLGYLTYGMPSSHEGIVHSSHVQLKGGFSNNLDLHDTCSPEVALL